MTNVRLAQAKSLEGATLPDGTKYTRKTTTEEESAEVGKPRPVSLDPGLWDTEDQPGEPGASDDDREAGL